MKRPADEPKVVFHMGDLTKPRKPNAPSLEGAALSVTCDAPTWLKISPRLADGRMYVLSNPDPRWLVSDEALEKRALTWAVNNDFLEPREAWAVCLSDGTPLDFTASKSKADVVKLFKESGFDPETETIRASTHYFFGRAGAAYWREHFGHFGIDTAGGHEADLAILFYGEAHSYGGIWWPERSPSVTEGFGRAPRGAIFQSAFKRWSLQDLGPVTKLMKKNPAMFTTC